MRQRALPISQRVVYYPPPSRGVRAFSFPGMQGFGGFGGLGSYDNGGGVATSCGCELPGAGNAATDLASLIRSRPFIWVAGAFLLGYLAKGKR